MTFTLFYLCLYRFCPSLTSRHHSTSIRFVFQGIMYSPRVASPGPLQEPGESPLSSTNREHLSCACSTLSLSYSRASFSFRNPLSSLPETPYDVMGISLGNPMTSEITLPVFVKRASPGPMGPGESPLSSAARKRPTSSGNSY